MPLYMFEAKFTSQAWANLMKSKEDRRGMITEAIEKIGGKVIAMYVYVGGDHAGMTIFEAPNAIAAKAFELANVAAGHHLDARTTELITVDDVMKSLDQVIVDYKPPG